MMNIINKILTVFIVLCCFMQTKLSLADMSDHGAELYGPMITSDIIIVGTVTPKKWLDGARLALLEVRSPTIVSINKSIVDKSYTSKDVIYIINGANRSLNAPIIMIGKEQMLCLKKVEVSIENAAVYGIQKNALVFEACEGEQSSVPTDFSTRSIAVQNIRNLYGIENGKELVDSVTSLMSYRNLETKDLKTKHLLKIISDNKGKNVYDKLSILLLSSVIIGDDDVVIDDRKFVERVDEINSLMPWQNSTYKRRFANRLLVLLNRESNVEYKNVFLTLLSKLRLKPVAINGKFRFEVPGKEAGSKWVGPLPE